jgi:predicted DNA-binding transcriptional regulator AlpA
MPSSLEHLILKVKTRNFRAVRKVLEQLAEQETLKSKAPKRQPVSQNVSIQTCPASRLLAYNQLNPLKGISFSRQHLYRLEKAGEFPCRFQLSPGERARKFWWEREIDEWPRSKAKTRS